MVHALEEIHRLLKPDGRLIDIHPLPEAPLIEVHQGGKIIFAAPAPAPGLDSMRQAEGALAQVVQRRLFVVEQSGIFDFLVYAASVSELHSYLEEADSHKDSPPDEAAAAEKAELSRQVDVVMQAAGEGTKVAFHERARITRLRSDLGYMMGFKPDARPGADINGSGYLAEFG